MCRGGFGRSGYNGKENVAMKKKISTAVLAAVFLAGLSLLLYPTVSDYWNSLRQSKLITNYADQVADLDNDTYAKIWESAAAYNRKLAGHAPNYRMTEEAWADYLSQLSVSDSGIIAYIEIPKINCFLPIYHGTDEDVLQVAVGHIEWSSLPTGGESTHCVLSGHRGLPSTKLFTDLDKLTEGDTFTLRVLDETLTYEVDQIRTVLPEELRDLEIVKGEDYCTLVTCTPYSVNSHRLLVRGHRIENTEEAKNIRVTADAMQIEPTIVAPLVAAPVLLILLIVLLVKTGGNSKKNKESDSDETIEKNR